MLHNGRKKFHSVKCGGGEGGLTISKLLKDRGEPAAEAQDRSSQPHDIQTGCRKHYCGDFTINDFGDHKNLFWFKGELGSSN